MRTKIYKLVTSDNNWFRYITLITENRRVLLKFSSDYIIQKQLTSNFIKKLYSIVEKDDDKAILLNGGICAIVDRDILDIAVELKSQPAEYSLLIAFDIK